LFPPFFDIRQAGSPFRYWYDATPATRLCDAAIVDQD